MAASMKNELIDQLPPEHQAAVYKERFIQLSQAVERILPIVDEHDRVNYEYDEPGFADGLRRQIDLNKRISRTLFLPSPDFTLNGVPDGLSREELWNACLDQVVAANRGFGVNTGSLVHTADSATGKVYSIGWAARDPIGKVNSAPKTRMFRFLAKLFGEPRVQRFVNRNSQYYRPFWLWDVADPRPLPKD